MRAKWHALKMKGRNRERETFYKGLHARACRSPIGAKASLVLMTWRVASHFYPKLPLFSGGNDAVSLFPVPASEI